MGATAFTLLRERPWDGSNLIDALFHYGVGDPADLNIMVIGDIACSSRKNLAL
ncbi:hypothetical protein GA0115233_104424 [Streptomyces sp. DI166]|uniref:hypothetical protein n=1 Tax=Streptomyces sp. DI166 TaxID=1839783 RepID=UPI0007F3E83C|nr:hypothetical protein [Streptomyces sp. DI166]SBT92373.1 hypothetical protein GA0115233_104424 [Streptomyces sp. DI166]